jgi:hypothetical protein
MAIRPISKTTEWIMIKFSIGVYTKSYRDDFTFIRTVSLQPALPEVAAK